jgi:hypothetical protein
MSDSITFPASKKKAALLFLGSLIFVALGIWLRVKEPLIGWACIVFFGLGIPVSFFTAFSNKIFLRLDSHGFEMGAIGKSSVVAWNDIDRFEMVSMSGNKMIAIYYNESYQEQRSLRKAASAISGIEGGIANNYNAPLPEILQTLQEWHARFGKTSD